MSDDSNALNKYKILSRIDVLSNRIGDSFPKLLN